MTRSSRVKALLVVLVAAFIAVTFAFARSEKVRSEPALSRVDSVVLFAIPNLGIDDVDPDVMPVLDRLSRQGAIAATNVRTKGNSPDLVDAYATLGAGNRVAIADREPAQPTIIEPSDDPATGTEATTTTVPLDPSTGEPVAARPIEPTAVTVGARALGLPSSEPDLIVLREMGEIVGNADAGNDPGAQPGALADALRRAGMRSALVSNAHVLSTSVPEAVSVPAAVAAADRYGLIDRGSIAGDLLVPDPGAPGAVTADPDSFVAAVDGALGDSQVVVVDPGETIRAATTAALLTAGPDAEQLRSDALSRTDGILGALAADLDDDTLLVVVGVTPPGDRWALTPMVMSGGDTPRGYLHSSSTHRPDLVTLTDLAPTVLDALGVDAPGSMIGNPLAYRPGDADWEGALALDELLENRAPIDKPMAVGFIVVQTVVYLVAIAVLVTDRSRPAWFDKSLLFVVVTCGAWPLVTFWLRIVPSLYSYGAGTFVLCWLIAAVVAFGVTRLRRHVLDPVLALCALTVATLVVDLATGAHLQYGSFFGYAPTTAPRFIGIGNAAFALLGGATVAVCTALVARSKDRSLALWCGGAVAVVVVVADGAPWMGTDVGGILTLVPVLCLMFWALAGRRVRWHTIGLAVLAAAAVLGIAVGVESLRDPGQRTHIGRFFLESADGTTVQDTFLRKWDANTDVLRRSPLAWAVPVLAGAGFVAVASGRAFKRVLPLGSPERTGVTATLAMGFVGWILNDSGVVVLALAAVFLGPYILLLAQERSAGGAADQRSTGTVGPPMPDDETGLVSGTDQPEPASTDPLVSQLSELPESPVVVALVPAKDRADSVGDTVQALLALDAVDRVLVIDDGSSDDTADAAFAAGADVLRLDQNRGKGGAVAAGVQATPEAHVYLLIDADLARTADAADLLLGPVLRDEADLVVGVLPPAGGRGGFGKVRDFAARGIRRACGLEVSAPISGQRAIRAELLRGLRSAERFGLEVAMTIEVARAGGRFAEVDVPMDHLHTGRSVSGFAHRGRQGLDIAVALWPRVTSPTARRSVLVLATALICIGAVALGSLQVPTTSALAATPERVLVFGMQPLSFDDLDRGVTPNLQRLIDEGSIGAMSVRTVTRRPNDGEGYLSLGAGARLRSGSLLEEVIRSDTPVGSATAADYVRTFTGLAPQGEYVVMGGASVISRNDNAEAASTPGALGDALRSAGKVGAVVGNSDQPASYVSEGFLSRPAALVVMTGDLGVERGHLEPEEVLEPVPGTAFGLRANADGVVSAALQELERSEVVVVDPGDLARTARFDRAALPAAAEGEWESSLERTDEILGRIVDGVDPDTLVLVVSVVPSGGPYRPTPLVAWGSGVPKGRITSPSTRQSGLSAVTDLAPTILDALGVDPVEELPGNAIRYEAGPARLGDLHTLDADTQVREATYGPVSTRYIQAFTVLYLLATAVVCTGRAVGRWQMLLRRAGLMLAAFPVATFLARLIPGLTTWFTTAQALASVALALAIGWAVDRRATRPLVALARIAAITIAVIVVDSWTGSRLHVSGWLGYSVHNAGRFYGIPNTTFAVLGGLTLILAGVVVHRSERRDDALWLVGCIFTVVLVSAGLPMLGADVGSLITLFPVFAITLIVLGGRNMKPRSLVIAGVAMVALVAVAAGLDMSRPADQQSHLGRFTEELLDDGPSALLDTFTRKQSANFRLLSVSQWSEIAPVALIFLAIPLLWQRRFPTVFPAGGALRTAFWSIVAATILGFASNDSGPIVIALFLTQLAPFVLMALLSPTDDGVLRLAADGSRSGATGAAGAPGNGEPPPDAGVASGERDQTAPAARP